MKAKNHPLSLSLYPFIPSPPFPGRAAQSDQLLPQSLNGLIEFQQHRLPSVKEQGHGCCLYDRVRKLPVLTHLG